MKPEPSSYQTLLCALLCAAFVFICGCDSPVVVDNESGGKNLPKMKFHKPKTFNAAVSRLEKIHKAVMSEDALPAPTVFTVVEVVHGTGAGAHSHYHLADDHDHDHDGHGHVTSSEKTYEVEVDAITEMVDIVRWLPKIAGDGDMKKGDWQQVSSESEKLTSEIGKEVDSSKDLAAQRTALKKLDAQVSGFVAAMSKLVVGSAAEEQQSTEPKGD